MINCNIPYVQLSTGDISKLKHKVIGQGKEGIVYKAKNGLLYKLYRDPSIYSINPIIKAVNRQSYVKNTTLPLGVIFINDNFSGCILKQHRGYIDIHNITGFPRKIKLIVLRKLLSDIKELSDNFIYHHDLANKRIDKRTHSNILISANNSIEIIDIDGNSTYYSDGYNKNYEEMCYVSLTILMAEILFEIDISNNLMDADIDVYSFELKKIGLSNEFIRMIFCGQSSHDQIKELLNYVEKNKIRTISN